MNGSDFERLMRSVFRPFLEELGFAMQPIQVSGRLYGALFIGHAHTVDVSFEPGDDYARLQVVTNGLEDLHSIDDPSKSPHLSHLNSRYMGLVTADERAENDAYFGEWDSSDPIEHQLFKWAKELRLVLPRYLAS